MKKPATWLVLSTAVLLAAAAAAPALADGRTSRAGGSGDTGLKAMWMDATAWVGDRLAGLVRPDRRLDRDVAGLGSTLDPDGYTAEDGPSNDPDGNRATGEGGPDLDPNG